MVPDSRSAGHSSAATIAFLLLSLFLLLAGYLYYVYEKGRISAEVHGDLAAIADLKASQIVQWLEERKGDGEALLASNWLARHAAVAIASGRGSDAWREMIAWAEKTRAAFKCRSVLLLDPDGNPVMGVGGDADKVAEVTRMAAREAARARRVTTVDLHVGSGGHISLNVLAPLPTDEREGTVAAVVLLRIDPNDDLYPLIQRWPTPSASGETLLVRREGDEVVYLNEVRHVRGAALSMRRPMSTPGLIAAEGIRSRSFLVEGVDYRGVPGIGVLRPIPGTSWYLVAKVDAEEVNRPIRDRAWTILLLVGLLLLAAGSTTALLEKRKQSRLYRRLYEAEVERQALVQHFDWLTRYANDVILLSDGEGRIVEANERALSTYGYTREEMVGLSLQRLFSPDHSQDIERNREKARQSGGVIYETIHMRKDGTTFPVEVSARVLTRDGGAESYAQEIIRDISDRRAAEEGLARTLKELERKNRELDAFARTAAHDLRQPLTVVSGLTQFLNKQLAPSLRPEHEKLFAQIRESISHLDRFLEDLLVLSRLDAAPPPAERVQVGPLMEQIARYYGGPLAECGGTWKVEADLPDLFLPQTLAREVFENLFSNSVKYRRPGVPPFMEIGVSRGKPLAPAGHREFVFRDNGKGIAPDDQPKVFDLFYRAKEETASGTGLGLAIVKGIVEQAGGTIRLESAPGEGTTFFFSLPVAE